jgi:hypothetical protein
LSGLNILAPKVGICANEISLTNSVVDTSGRGCLSDQGIGAGSGRAICAGSGGAHGGRGGWGEPYLATNQKECQ